MIQCWPLSKDLLIEILSDHVSDQFVCQLIWERLGYEPKQDDLNHFSASLETPDYWSKKFPEAPELISKRSASVHLTRSIPKEYKQTVTANVHTSSPYEQRYLIGLIVNLFVAALFYTLVFSNLYLITSTSAL